jgi:lysophospholipase L1-like esterase
MKINLCVLLVTLLTSLNAASKIKLACIGNSITAGTSNYPTYLQKLLGSDYQVENDGVGGTTMLKKGDSPYWTKGRLREALAFRPDIATIKLGTNDTKSQNWDVHGGEFKDDYCSMIDTLNTLSTKPDIFLVLPVPVFRDNYGIRNGILEKIIVIIKEIGAERGLPVIDANTPLLGFGDYFSDGIHPNAAASDTIAHVIHRALVTATPIVFSGGSRAPACPEINKQPMGRYLSLPGLAGPSAGGYELNGRAFRLNDGENRSGVPSVKLYRMDGAAAKPAR